jgi:hypothetical protein
MDQQRSNGAGMDDVEAEVARARLSFEQGLREASVVGTRAARRMMTPAIIGVGVVGGALLLMALVRLARRPRDGALIRIVVETPRSPKRMLPVVGGAVARWVLERQLRGGGPLGALAAAAAEGGKRTLRERAARAFDSSQSAERFRT